MTKRVCAGILILALAVGFSVFSEFYLRDTVRSLGEKADGGDLEGFEQEYSRKKVFLQFLLNDSALGELDGAWRKLCSEDTRKEGQDKIKEVLLRIEDEYFFSLVKLF